MSDPWDDPEVQDWVRHVRRELVPKLADTAAVVSLVPDDAGDVKFWVELGASIMMEKPIIVVAIAGRPVPERLRFIADEVIELDSVRELDPQALAAAIKRVAT